MPWPRCRGTSPPRWLSNSRGHGSRPPVGRPTQLTGAWQERGNPRRNPLPWHAGLPCNPAKKCGACVSRGTDPDCLFAEVCSVHDEMDRVNLVATCMCRM